MAFYRKNIGGAQQVARIVAGVGAGLAALFLLQPPISLVGLAAGMGFAATGLVGFCPMCAMVGIGRDRN